ncbi:MAG: phosphoenolpyruvate carboxykinase (GTP), partial [Deltaproteobacteria bacterium]|nr:phosphoenolpyruvate carboxykinase (GTP) [Deltaproteobacteria bacterium]
MLERKKGIDIVMHLGGIDSFDTAMDFMEKKLDKENFNKIQKIKNPEAILKIANAIAMCGPETVFINTGSEEDRQHIRDLAIKQGEEAALPMKNHTIHYDLKDEQGRIVDRTYYIVNEGEKTSVLAKKMLRADAIKEVQEKMTGIMEGRTMMVGFYMRGPVGSPAANPAIEITTSAYVSHSAEILYRNAFEDFEKEVEDKDHFYTNVHSEGPNRLEDLPNARVFMDRSFQTTYSMFCTYAGNTLLLKKGNHRFSVDRSVYEKIEEELAEHMFVTGIDGPGGRVTWCAGAAPSGCGKTTTAMAGNHFV